MMPSIAQTIYDALLFAGATPTQAAGIMGNMMAESGLNPETQVMDSNGAEARGLVQWNDKGEGAGLNWSKLITGNTTQDIVQQVLALKQQGGFAAASGATAAEAASNFMRKFERPAAASANESRRVNIATLVHQAATSGNWDTISSAATPAGQGGGQGQAQGLTSIGNQLISNAMSWRGTPYVYGGTSRSGVDCSGFTQAVYASVGVNIGRDTSAQFQGGTPVGQDGNWSSTISQLQPGDLIFYGRPGATGPSAHVVMYIGNGQVIQAAHTGTNVEVTPLFQSASADEPFLGVRRYTNAGSSVDGTAGFNYGASQGSVDTYIEQNYPDLAWMYNVPELKPIFQQADSNQWSEQQLQAALQNTNWWKGHAESARSWANLQATDPATAQRELQQAETQIQYLFTQYGIQPNATLVLQLATQKMELGLNDQEVQLAVLNSANFQYTEKQYGSGGTGAGQIGDYIAQIKQVASQYFYKISDQAAYNWAVQMMKVGGTPTSADNNAGFTTYLQHIAESQYPWLSKQIAQGMTPAQYFDPYKQQSASLMEVSPYAIDIENNPTWNKMSSFVDPNGVKRSMTLSEAATYTRSQPGWNDTQNANQQYSQMGDALLKGMGAIQ